MPGGITSRLLNRCPTKLAILKNCSRSIDYWPCVAVRSRVWLSKQRRIYYSGRETLESYTGLQNPSKSNAGLSNIWSVLPGVEHGHDKMGILTQRRLNWHHQKARRRRPIFNKFIKWIPPLMFEDFAPEPFPVCLFLGQLETSKTERKNRAKTKTVLTLDRCLMFCSDLLTPPMNGWNITTPIL